MENREIAIQLSGVKKMYKLGQIGGGTLTADLQSWWARVRGKEDPNTKIGTNQRLIGQTFMALNGIDLTVYKGEALGIIGSNGAGKSTMLKLLSQVTAPTEGTIRLNGRVASMLEVGTGFHPELTGRENVYMNGAILGMTRAEIDAKMEQIIEFSEVRDFIDTPVKRYSSGMFVKLAFSVSAHLDSEIMIMAEVLAVGAMAFQKKCLDKMRDAAKQEGRTVVYVSHNMNTIRQLCDRCVVLDKGKVIFEGDVEKAIAVYMGNNSTTYPAAYNFVNNKRGNHFGQQVFLTDFRFLNKQTAEFSVGEKVEYEICFDSTIAMEALMCIIRIRDQANGALVAGSLSKPFPVKVGKGQSVRICMNLEGLVAADYSFSLEVVERDQTGNYYSYDNPYAAMPVQITNPDAADIVWSTRYWGNVRLEDAAVLE